MKATEIKNFEDACHNDPTVRAAIAARLSHKELIGVLAEQKRLLIEMIVQLESIAPRKVTVEGKTYVWHCPDHLVPDHLFKQ
jgi:hypothetical protein